MKLQWFNVEEQTLFNTVFEMHLLISNLLEYPSHHAEVLPAIELPKAPQ
jgi:hypothetical protein